MLQIDPSLSLDLQVLVKAAYHLTQKGRTQIRGGVHAGYVVPKREFDRVRSKVRRFVKEVPDVF